MSDWVVSTSVNRQFMRLFLNWQFSLLNCCPNLQSVYVFCEDNIVAQHLKKNSSFQFITRGRTSKAHALDFGDKDYRQLVTKRPLHILSLVKNGKHVLYTDVDTVFIHNPFKYIHRFKEDVLAPIDMKSWRQWTPYYCTGIMSIRSNRNTIALLRHWHNLTLEPRYAHYMNQPLFNIALRKTPVTVRALDVRFFPPGSVLKKGRLGTTIIAHANFVKGIDAKITLLRQVNAWYTH